MSFKRTYNEVRKLKTFEERFAYLKLSGSVGIDTFGFDRIYNQQFYKSSAWKSVRNKVISRDKGCDLGIEDLDIMGQAYVHHINPITIKDIQNSSDKLLDMNNLICVSRETHNAIHYGDSNYVNKNKITVRKKNDTILWKGIHDE